MTNKTLGQYLKELRKSFNYTQEFAASQLDVSRQAYSHYENGRAIPPNDTLYKIASLYNVPVEMLIELSLQSDNNVLSEEPQPYRVEIDYFLEYINAPENIERYKNLSNKEKQAIYYFNNIPATDQDEILEILKIKLRKNQ